MLKAAPFASRPMGEITGTVSASTALRICASSTPTTSPTKPRSTSSPFSSRCKGSLVTWKTSLPGMPTARPPNSLIVSTIFGLIVPLKTSSTIRIDCSHVTRRPLTNRALMPASRIRLVIALPPPWIRTGLMPTASKNTTSRSSRSTVCSSSIALPPYLMTKSWPRYFCMNGRASISDSVRAK